METAIDQDHQDVSPEVIRLAGVIRELGFGELKIKCRNGVPVIVEKGVKTIKLD